MIATFKPKKAKIYINKGRKTIAEIVKETGCTHIINGGFYESNWKACPWLRADGENAASAVYNAWGYAWNTGEDIVMTNQPEKYDNFISGVDLINPWDGVVKKLNYKPDVGGSRPRTAIGQLKDGSILLWCDKAAMTPEALQAAMVSLGCVTAIMLDGGGSTQCIFPVGSVDSNRVVHNLLCFWDSESAKEDEPTAKTDIDKLLDIARGEIGVKENPMGSNRVKYNTEYYGTEVQGSAYPWCCAFVWWLFKQAGISDLFYGGNKTAYCPTALEWYKSKGMFSQTPRVGAVVFYAFNSKISNHIGIVEEIDADGGIIAIEGNTSVTSDDNGGAVMRRRRTAAQIVGYGYPFGETTESSGGDCAVELPVLQKGSKGKSVKALQLLLVGNGYSCGSAGADGDFGSGTYSAVIAFQKAKGLAVDGIVGTNTWTALLR